MAVINIKRKHNLSTGELNRNIQQISTKFEKKLKFRSYWETETSLIFIGKGAKGCIEISDSEFELTIRLGMMYKSMKTAIENEILLVVDEYI